MTKQLIDYLLEGGVKERRFRTGEPNSYEYEVNSIRLDGNTCMIIGDLIVDPKRFGVSHKEVDLYLCLLHSECEEHNQSILNTQTSI